MLVVGEKEQTAGTVAVRDRVDGDLGAMPVPMLSQRAKPGGDRPGHPPCQHGHNRRAGRRADKVRRVNPCPQVAVAMRF